MARNTKPRIIRTPLKRVKTTDPFPVLPGRRGIGLGALEKMWHIPASQIRQWVTDGLLSQQPNGLFSSAEINRFNREKGDLFLTQPPSQSPGEREAIPDPDPEDPEA